jgi:hypothetical protein
MLPAPNVEAHERKANLAPRSGPKLHRPNSHACGHTTGGLSSARQVGRASLKPMTHARTTSSQRSIGDADSPATPFSRPGEWR